MNDEEMLFTLDRLGRAIKTRALAAGKEILTHPTTECPPAGGKGKADLSGLFGEVHKIYCSRRKKANHRTGVTQFAEQGEADEVH